MENYKKFSKYSLKYSPSQKKDETLVISDIEKSLTTP